MLTPEFLFKNFWCVVGFVGLCVLLFLLAALGKVAKVNVSKQVLPLFGLSLQ